MPRDLHSGPTPRGTDAAAATYCRPTRARAADLMLEMSAKEVAARVRTAWCGVSTNFTNSFVTRMATAVPMPVELPEGPAWTLISSLSYPQCQQHSGLCSSMNMIFCKDYGHSYPTYQRVLSKSHSTSTLSETAESEGIDTQFAVGIPIPQQFDTRALYSIRPLRMNRQ
jgi:hypothetical protein